MLKKWIALKVHSDWQVKFQISFAIYLRATQEKKGIPVYIHDRGRNDPNYFFCGVYYLTVSVFTKTTMHLSVSG